MASRRKRPPLIGDVKNCAGMRVMVFVNQKPVDRVIYYNCETGKVIKEKQNAKGAIATEELTGSVLVKRID